MVIKGAKQNDRSCQKYLYARFAEKLFQVCRRYVDARLDPKDILQDAFIQIFKSIHLYESAKGQFESWAKTIVIRTALKARRNARITYEAIDDSCVGMVSADVSAYERLLEDDLLALVDTLPPGYKQVFKLYVLDEYTHKEIAELLGIKEASSRSQLKRARELLKKELKKRSENFNRVMAIRNGATRV